MITKALFKIAKKAIPPMSHTEQVAIDAGDTWWEKEIFSGKPNWSKLHDLKISQMSDEEQAFFDNETEQLCAMLDDWQICHELKDLPESVWNFMKDKGFFGLVIAKEYGGKGFSAAAHSAIVLKIASCSTTAAVTVMVPNSLGPAELLHHYGTDEQKNHYLPRLATGEEIPCFGLTSTHAGSDAGSMIDQGVVCKGVVNGEEVLGIRLNFAKRYITLAPIATLIGLAFKLTDPDHLLGDDDKLGITLALLPRDLPGLEIGQRHIPLDIPFMNGPMVGTDCFIPLDSVIGGPKQVGMGWKMLMECLSIGRSISLPAVGAANAAVSFLSASAYAVIRKQFKVSLNMFEGVDAKLGEIGGLSYAIEAMRLLTLSAVDEGKKPSTCSAIAKYHMTELSRTALNNAMDIHGGKAIILGPSNYLGRNYQGVPVGITVEGANILTRNLMIFGQGAVRCHPCLLELFQSIKSDDQKAFGSVIYRFVGGAFMNYFKAACIGVTAGRFLSAPNSELKRYYQNVHRMSSFLALASDVALMFLGGQLKRKENLSARLGDVLSYLTMASAVLKQWEESPHKASEKAVAKWALDFCLFEAQEAMIGFLRHFPNRFLAWVISRKCFVWGRPFKAPSDQLTHQVSKSMLDPGLRERFLNRVYHGEGNLGDLEKALASEDEALIQQIIGVDAFDEWK